MKKHFFRSDFFILHPFLEFSLILVIALGDFIVSAFKWISVESSGDNLITYGNDDIMSLLTYESIVLLVVIIILKWQRWSLKNLGINFSIEKITAGLVLFVSNYFLYLLLYKMFGEFLLSFESGVASTPTISFSTSLNILPLTLFSVFNPIFEEFILVGYIISAMRNKFGIFTCVLVSVIFRLSFHVYQGPIILLSILPMGIIYSVYFWYKKSLTPLIIGHSLTDALSFYILMTIHGH